MFLYRYGIHHVAVVTSMLCRDTACARRGPRTSLKELGADFGFSSGRGRLAAQLSLMRPPRFIITISLSRPRNAQAPPPPLSQSQNSSSTTTITIEPAVEPIPQPYPTSNIEQLNSTMADAAAEVKAPEELTPAEVKAEESTPATAPAEATPAKAAEETSEVPPPAPAKDVVAAAESAPEPVPKDDDPAAAEEPKTTAAPAEGAVTQPEAATKAPPAKPLTKLFAELEAIKKEADYGEMWGVELSDEDHVPSAIVLEKFLRANNKDVAKAKAQLTDALKWRKQIQPAKILQETEFDSAKYGGLGYVTIYPKTDKHEKEILTWNIYGAVKDIKATFGNVEE